ncbi:helix-turn-helix transcriptional regulator [Pseudothauera lacus]|nr:LuxR family transcriptional regulator [Pseudothauera lacus]
MVVAVVALPGELIRAGGFTLYVLWLTALPMSGPLLGETGDMAWFLWPQCAMLLLCARFASARIFQPLLFASVLLTAVLTIAFIPLQGSLTNPVLASLGVVSAPLSIYMGVLLKGGERPVILAALGLAGGNLLNLALGLLPLSDASKLGLLAGALPGILLAPGARAEHLSGPCAGLPRYLPFVMFFQLVSGLMYGQMLPAYHAIAVLPGSELLLYIGGAFAVIGLSVRNRELTVLLGVGVAMLAFACWQLLPATAAKHAGVHAMMAAAGIVDLFLLAYVLSFTNQLRAYGYGVAALVGGIAAGHWLSGLTAAHTDSVSLVALILLNLSVLALFVQRARQTPQLAENLPPSATAVSSVLPPTLEKSLSVQERQVLLAVLSHRTYREVGATLGISESSVKTYMQRIYRKTGVFRRDQLIGLLAESTATAPGSAIDGQA